MRCREWVWLVPRDRLHSWADAVRAAETAHPGCELTMVEAEGRMFRLYADGGAA